MGRIHRVDFAFRTISHDSKEFCMRELLENLHMNEFTFKERMLEGTFVLFQDSFSVPAIRKEQH